ncbi:unnamed protein product [Rotaria sp. Silwood2]|nr:unnamed protein product [Rotaria sp. Silwood2]CAF2771439.1 unnamed protein product [Rotaria sp. Silwood2]CAF3279483.1 unnamed protein product [Rotaria sp. Silwood2]CAF4121967.1 unnamed protein product [Rotaria sp. Silwood2]CAF4161004.1 unnamed protein product [Rotaria sp. Silwood2]
MNLSDKQKHALRFCDISEGPGRMMPPIQGYETMPLVTLENAVKPLSVHVPEVERMVWIVKHNCVNPPGNLLPDESASIMLYTLEWEPRENSFYMVFNNTLRAENRLLIKPWFLYMKLFITALSKIRSEHRFLYRGVKLDVSADYPQGKTFVWWSFSSCTSSIHVLKNEDFLGKTGPRTLFTIDCHSSKDICQHSMYKKEDEALLLAARQFKVVSQMNAGNGLNMILIKEINPPYPLLEPLPMGNTSASAKTLPSISSMKMHSHGSYHNEKLEQTISKCQSRKLNLSGQQLNDQDMEIVIKQGMIDKQCTILDLMSTKITQRGVSILANALRDNKCLEELNISHNNISDSGIRYLSSTINSSVLKQLDLAENDISDEGAKYLAEMLETNTHLLGLLLSENQIGDDGVNMFANSLTHGNTSLEFLNLSANTDISDESIDSLVNMMEHNRSLKKIDLRHNNLSKDGEARLRAVAKLKKGFELWLSHFV